MEENIGNKFRNLGDYYWKSDFIEKVIPSILLLYINFIPGQCDS